MNSLYQQAKFLISVPELKLAPADSGFEVAFAGRSNAGKSSALNTITSQNALARTSKRPGRTQQLVFFELDNDRRLVDLPGYGYAKVPLPVKRKWHTTMQHYLANRRSLQGIFLLVDIRRALTDFDLQMIDYCEHIKMPLHVALTKADKVTRGGGKNTFFKVQNKLENLTVPCSIQLFSALKRQGIDAAHTVLDDWLEISGR